MKIVYCLISIFILSASLYSQNEDRANSRDETTTITTLSTSSSNSMYYFIGAKLGFGLSSFGYEHPAYLVEAGTYTALLAGIRGMLLIKVKKIGIGLTADIYWEDVNVMDTKKNPHGFLNDLHYITGSLLLTFKWNGFYIGAGGAFSFLVNHKGQSSWDETWAKTVTNGFTNPKISFILNAGYIFEGKISFYIGLEYKIAPNTGVGTPNADPFLIMNSKSLYFVFGFGKSNY